MPSDHPLNSSWVIWEHRDDSGSSYGGNMHQYSIITRKRIVEEFWGYWNNIPKPSEIFYDGISRKKFVDRSIQSFSVFKEGIRPEWEDPCNAVGGEWFIRKRMASEPLDAMWDKFILGLIGETIDPEDEVNGARIVYKSRKDQGFFRFEIWLRSRNRNAADAVRSGLLNCLNTGNENMRFHARDCVYKEHNA